MATEMLMTYLSSHAASFVQVTCRVGLPLDARLDATPLSMPAVTGAYRMQDERRPSRGRDQSDALPDSGGGDITTEIVRDLPTSLSVSFRSGCHRGLSLPGEAPSLHCVLALAHRIG